MKTDLVGKADMSDDEWRIVEQNDLYEVCRSGKVRRVGKSVLMTRRLNTGYDYVSLSKASKVTSVTIHRLVCIAFHGQPDGRVVNHIDGDKTNNHAENLEWVTYGQNNKHAFDTGLKKPTDSRGERNGRAKLTNEAVAEIRDNPHSLTGVALARKFKVTPQLVSLVRQGKSWPEGFQKTRSM
ncbi:HNH endonuclease signature motif containing protein [Rhizobium favelukesii]|uniref:HNH endonuclease signature motif containing protein n=1 Tax=Rhizobium favelukesii TaxID=348824 RepID=UPI000684A7D8|nr:HNH endonuclease signature motif containing protein [Rhizobium favelukesii]